MNSLQELADAFLPDTFTLDEEKRIRQGQGRILTHVFIPYTFPLSKTSKSLEYITCSQANNPQYYRELTPQELSSDFVSSLVKNKTVVAVNPVEFTHNHMVYMRSDGGVYVVLEDDFGSSISDKVVVGHISKQ
ncbi:MAG: hypothetical protein ACMXYD_04200 [Candidatus Woesearchaeota archaeon]